MRTEELFPEWFSHEDTSWKSEERNFGEAPTIQERSPKPKPQEDNEPKDPVSPS